MGNALFDTGREGFLVGEINCASAVIKAALVRGYAFNPAHKFMADVIGAGGVIVASVQLAGITTAAGVLDATDATFAGVPNGAQIADLVLYQASAPAGGADVVPGAQRLVAFIDSATGLPVTPNGGDIAVGWDNGPNRIFKL